MPTTAAAILAALVIHVGALVGLPSGDNPPAPYCMTHECTFTYTQYMPHGTFRL